MRLISRKQKALQKRAKESPCGAKRHTQFKTLSNGGNKKVCFRKIPPKIARCTDRQNERGFFNVCLKNSLFVLYASEAGSSRSLANFPLFRRSLMGGGTLGKGEREREIPRKRK